MALFRFGNNFDDMFGNMDNMMNQLMGGMLDPFGMSPFGRPGGQQQQMNPHEMMSPFNHFIPLQNMIQQATMMPQANGGTSFVSSSFVSFSSNGNNPPQIYEETKMNSIGPGGVREERHTVRDSRTGLQKMKVGRHIQDRGHVMERSKNHYTGDEEENNEYINIEEEEAPQFQQEWSARMASNRPNNGNHMIQGPSRTQRLAITAGPASESPPQQQSVEPRYHVEFPPSSSTSNGSNSSNETKNKLKIKSILKNKKSGKKPYKKNTGE